MVIRQILTKIVKYMNTNYNSNNLKKQNENKNSYGYCEN